MIKLNNKSAIKRIKKLFNHIENDKRLTLLGQRELVKLIKENYSIVVIDANKEYSVGLTQMNGVVGVIKDIRQASNITFTIKLHLLDNSLVTIIANNPSVEVLEDIIT